MTEVHAITSAGRSQSEQINDRTRSYLIMMAFRVAAIVAAFVIDSWVRWLCVAAAALIPMIAVIIANGSSERREMPGTYIDTHALTAEPEQESEQQ